jgi:predicted homoserine dehydrogenase-like protein
MLKQALDRRAEQGRPIQVGVVGAGRVGTGAICQIGLMKGSRNAFRHQFVSRKSSKR